MCSRQPWPRRTSTAIILGSTQNYGDCSFPARLCPEATSHDLCACFSEEGGEAHAVTQPQRKRAGAIKGSARRVGYWVCAATARSSNIPGDSLRSSPFPSFDSHVSPEGADDGQPTVGAQVQLERQEEDPPALWTSPRPRRRRAASSQRSTPDSQDLR